MKLQFRYMNGRILDIKRAFIFRINFDKEYLFYTTDDFKDDDVVPIIFGELIGPSMVKVATDDREVVEKFLFALANNRVDNITNYQLVKYEQLEVTVLSGQKTKLPAYILNKYSYDFEIVMPAPVEVIYDPTPEINPVLEPTIIGPTKEVEKVDYTPISDTVLEEVTRETEEIPTNVILTPEVIGESSKEDAVPEALAEKVYEQLVNTDPVYEAMDTLDMDAVPLKINNDEPIYVCKEVFDRALKDVTEEPMIESIEEAASKEMKPSIDKKDTVSHKRKRGISFYANLAIYIILIFGVVYFGARWLGEKHNKDNATESKERTLVCETHLMSEDNYRRVSSVSDNFIDDSMIKHLNTNTLFFDSESAYLAFKGEHNNDDIKNSNGYRERYDYQDTDLTVVHVITIDKEQMSLEEWISHVGEDTSYTSIFSKYIEEDYICK